jgi:hypothetical protein
MCVDGCEQVACLRRAIIPDSKAGLRSLLAQTLDQKGPGRYETDCRPPVRPIFPDETLVCSFTLFYVVLGTSVDRLGVKMGNSRRFQRT